MKTAYIITSAIESTSSPLTYSKTRSYFDSEERLRQTVMTVASLDQVSDHNTTLYLLDMSDNWEKYSEFFKYQTNLKFISVKHEFPKIYNEVTTHANKSRGETLATRHFLKSYETELKEYDVLVKISGRYFLDKSFDPSILSTDKIFFKHPRAFEWQDWWNYDAVRINNGNTLNQYCSLMFGWGREHFDTFLKIYTDMSNFLVLPAMQHYDIETLLYYYTRKLEQHIVETDWTVYGWLGPSGKFIRE